MSKYTPPSPAPVPADPVADPAVDPNVAMLRGVIGGALRCAHAIDHRSEELRTRGALRGDERSRLRVWANDADAAYALLTALRTAERYLVSVRHDPMA